MKFYTKKISRDSLEKHTCFLPVRNLEKKWLPNCECSGAKCQTVTVNSRPSFVAPSFSS